MTATQSMRAEAPPSNSPFCQTPTATGITDVLLACHHYRLLGTVIGNPGTGKSGAATSYAGSVSIGVAHVSMVKTARGVQAGLLHLLRSIGTGRWAARATREYEAQVMVEEAIKLELVELLIVDEAQHLSDDMLECLRDLYDHCGIGLVWMGNFTLSDRWAGRRGARTRAFEAILGRRGPQIEIDALGDGDIDALATHYGIDDAASRDVLARAASARGGLHNVDRMLRVVGRGGGGRQLTAEALREAAMIAGVTV